MLKYVEAGNMMIYLARNEDLKPQPQVSSFQPGSSSLKNSFGTLPTQPGGLQSFAIFSIPQNGRIKTAHIHFMASITSIYNIIYICVYNII